jgi:hypothetical protein
VVGLTGTVPPRCGGVFNQQAVQRVGHRVSPRIRHDHCDRFHAARPRLCTNRGPDPRSAGQVPRIRGVSLRALQRRGRNRSRQTAASVAKHVRCRGTRNVGARNNMTSEPATLHMNYLNGEYANDAVSTWISGGCYDEIRRKLGYRFEVKRVEYTPTIGSGESSWSRSTSRTAVGHGSTSRGPPSSCCAADRQSTPTPCQPARPRTGLRAPRPESRPQPCLRRRERTACGPSSPTHAPNRIAYAVKLASLRGGVNLFDGGTGQNKLGVSITVL